MSWSRIISQSHLLFWLHNLSLMALPGNWFSTILKCDRGLLIHNIHVSLWGLHMTVTELGNPVTCFSHEVFWNREDNSEMAWNVEATSWHYKNTLLRNQGLCKLKHKVVTKIDNTFLFGIIPVCHPWSEERGQCQFQPTCTLPQMAWLVEDLGCWISCQMTRQRFLQSPSWHWFEMSWVPPQECQAMLPYMKRRNWLRKSFTLPGHGIYGNRKLVGPKGAIQWDLCCQKVKFSECCYKLFIWCSC